MGELASPKIGSRIFLGLVLAASACTMPTQPLPASTPTTSPALSTSFSKTADLISDPEIRKKVDRLAALSVHPQPNQPEGFQFPELRVDGEQTGIDGQESDEWKAFADLRAVISHADAKALLRHENAAIRSYFAEFVASTMKPEAPELLYPLYGDTARVEMRGGCTGAVESVADVALGEILFDTAAINLARKSYFELVIGDTRLKPKTRGLALFYLAGIDGKTARPLAIAATHDANPDWKREGVRALGAIQNDADIELIGAGTKSADPQDRVQAIEALSKIDSPQVRDLISPQLLDPDFSVKSAATYAYALQSTADDQAVQALLADTDITISSQTGRGLADRGTLHALELVEPRLMSSNQPLAGFELEGLMNRLGDSGTPIERHLLASKSINVVRDVTERLGRIGDQASIPAVRRLLVEGQISYVAAAALGNMKALDATDELVAALADENPNTRIAAAEALAKMNAQRALPAVAAAATKDTSFAKPNLVAAVAALKSAAKTQ